MKQSKGFTLMELMVTVAIVAILASIAIPSYTSYVRRGRMTDAFNQLSSYSLRLEQGFQNSSSYGAASAACVPAAPASTPYFVFACTVSADANSYTATATGSGSLLGYIYTIDAAGNRRTTKFANTAYAAPGKGCWMSTAGEC